MYGPNHVLNSLAVDHAADHNLRALSGGPGSGAGIGVLIDSESRRLPLQLAVGVPKVLAVALA